MIRDNERDGCVFCKILAGEAPGYIVQENEMAVALLDINPLSEGHCLVIPRRHVPWWHELTGEEVSGLFSLAHKTAEQIMAVYKPDFVAMYARGRRIPHTHIFLVPTSKGDPLDRHFNALEGFQEAAESLAKLRDPKTLKDAMLKLKSSP
jgi:histidine triad (HIT) family protein